MYKNVASLISALGLYAGMASAQGGNPIPIPAVNSQGSGGAAADCNGCYVVADVAGVVFGSETVTATQVNSVIVQPGTNGSYTTTQVNFDYGPFTFGPTAAPAATGAQSAYNTDSTLVLSGVTLTSPTAYNVFTAYSLTYSTYSNGACQVVAGPSTNLGSAYSVPIPQGVNPLDYEGAAQQSFVDFVHRPTCSLGGINFAATTHVPVSVATTAVTATNTNRATPMPVSIAATTTGPTATPTFVPLNGFNSSLATTYLPGGTGTFVVGGQTIMPGAAPRLSTVGSFFAGMVALAAGIVA